MNFKIAPEHTAVRVSLWRALHAKLDSQPLILEDTLGEKIINEANWESRPDMNPMGTRKVRASIVGRARFIEDLVEEKIKSDIEQIVILGAGVETFALRRTDLMNKISVYEIDQPGPQQWKINRLKEMHVDIPKNLHFVPVNFELENWVDKLASTEFDFSKPALIVSTGVTMYLSREANIETLKVVNRFVSGSVLATSFMLSPEFLPEEDRALLDFSMKKAAESGTPFISLFNPDEMIVLANESGHQNTKVIHSKDIIEKYFKDRTDQLIPAIGECFLILSK